MLTGCQIYISRVFEQLYGCLTNPTQTNCLHVVNMQGEINMRHGCHLKHDAVIMFASSLLMSTRHGKKNLFQIKGHVGMPRHV